MKLLMFIMAVLFTVPAQALTIPAGHVLERDANGIQQVVHGSVSALGVKGLTEDGFYIGGNQLHMQVGDVVVSIPLYDLVYKSKEGRAETVKTHVVAEILNIPHKQLDELKREDEDVTDTAKRILVEDALVEADINIDVDEVIEAIDEGVLDQVVEEAIQESEEVIEQAIEQVEEVVEQVVEIVEEAEEKIEEAESKIVVQYNPGKYSDEYLIEAVENQYSNIYIHSETDKAIVYGIDDGMGGNDGYISEYK